MASQEADWTDHDYTREELYERADDLFPFPGYRKYQDDILYETIDALFFDGVDNVIIEGPTGIGKSPLNVTIARLAWEVVDGKAFYTTPQKKLRNQLANDQDLRQYVEMLQARRDYTCDATGENCQDCPINNRQDKSCIDTDGCTYWDAKEDAMHSPLSAITFSMLIVDNYLPTYIQTGDMGTALARGLSGADDPMRQQISFEDRILGVLDECHSLEGQVASLHAGFPVSPWVVPVRVYQSAGKNIDYEVGAESVSFEDIEGVLDSIADRAEGFVAEYSDSEAPEIIDQVEKCESFLNKYRFASKEVNSENRPWVVEIDTCEHPEHDGDVKMMKLKPVDVDGFLKEFVWSRADKWLLTTATMPFRDNPYRWTDRLGLEGDTEVITKPMPFPAENRSVHVDTIVGEMSGGGDKRHWNGIVQKVKEIAAQHEGEKGLIHTASYARARRLYEALGEDNCMLHTGEQDAEAFIDRWAKSDADIMLSPSMTEGVDLYDDRCRWQVLLKVPYQQSGDPRVSYLLDERKDWDWYYECALLDIMQSVGRGVRSPEDHASYYVLDECFNDVMSRANAPAWFLEAIDKKPALA